MHDDLDPIEPIEPEDLDEHPVEEEDDGEPKPISQLKKENLGDSVDEDDLAEDDDDEDDMEELNERDDIESY